MGREALYATLLRAHRERGARIGSLTEQAPNTRRGTSGSGSGGSGGSELTNAEADELDELFTRHVRVVENSYRTATSVTYSGICPRKSRAIAK